MEKSEYELISRLDDYIDAVVYKKQACATRFLNPYEQSLAVNKLKNIQGLKYEILGGYDLSERNIIIIYRDEVKIDTEKFLSLVKIAFTKFDTKYINHRMILGSVLSLGITRDSVGDIVTDVDNHFAYVIATKKMAEYINNHLSKVAHANISTLYIDDFSSVKLNLKKPCYVSGTVASLRIDSILALALKASRNKTAEIIKNQMVYVNWQLVSKPTQIVKEGQIITVRKRGRILITDILGSTKKDRIRVKLQVTL